MEGWQCIVQVHDIVGTKPLDLPSIIQQMRNNKLGRLRKFYNDTLKSKRDLTKEKVIMFYVQTVSRENTLDLLFALAPYHSPITEPPLLCHSNS